MSSWKSSTTEFRAHSSPKRTRGLISRRWRVALRVSIACWKSAIRVSAQSRFPKRSGEFTAAARIGAVATWATLYRSTNSSADTWRWTWELVLHASSITESCLRLSSSVPSIRRRYSPPRIRVRASFRA